MPLATLAIFGRKPCSPACFQNVANAGGGIDVLGALQNIERDFEEGVEVAERLGPLLFGFVFEGGAEFGGIFPG